MADVIIASEDSYVNETQILKIRQCQTFKKIFNILWTTPIKFTPKTLVP